MTVGVIIVAAGRGERLGANVPKQLLDLGGRSMLRRSVDAFDGHAAVSCLVVVLPPKWVPDAPSVVGPTIRPCRTVAGGDRRQDSVRLGLTALPAAVDLVLVHDAARPFADAALIDRVVAAASRTGVSVPGVPPRDTVKQVDRATRAVIQTLPRDEIWLAQTPQGFRREALEEAVRVGATIEATDEAMLAERAGWPVEVVDGDEGNFKITTPEDLATARARLLGSSRVGVGYDLHRLTDGRRLVLAGVVISDARGPVGHSDGDVVCHALIDALLGAAGAGDIGRHFPDTDAAWTNAAGLDLLARAVSLVETIGWRPSNVDVTVILERPKIASHADRVRAALAAVLRLSIDEVSVKGKTNEGVDAIGRGEAIAAHAVALLRRGASR